MKQILKISLFAALLSLFWTPLFAFAQSGGINAAAIQPYANSIIDIINNIFVPVLLAIAFIVFLWGVYKYFILGAADPSSQAEGRQFVLWGIIGFTLIFTLWAIVNLLIGTLNLTNGQAPKPPTFNTGASQNNGFPATGLGQ